MLSSLSPARRRLALSMICAGLVAAVLATVAIAVSAGGSEHRQPRPAAVQDPGPVLLIPGYGGSTTALTVLAARLQLAGKQTSVVSLPGGGVGDLNAQAATVQTAASALLTRTGASSLDVVGYSAGGVVALLWVRNYGGASIARRVVTLGTPFHGTSLADLGSLFGTACPVACQQLTSASSLLAQLNKAGVSSLGPTFVSIWTTTDDVVVPPSSAQEDGAVDMTVQSVCPSATVGHSGLPTDPLVEAMVLAELQPGVPLRLVPAQCASLSRG
jgi:triacylglycerol lipase